MQPLCIASSPSPYVELIDCLSALQNNADALFRRITDKCQENRSRIDAFSARVTVAKQRLAQVKENHRRATIVHSPATFPNDVSTSLIDEIEITGTLPTVSSSVMHPLRASRSTTAPVNSIALPTAADMWNWPKSGSSSSFISTQPSRGAPATRALGECTSIASLIRPQLGSAKPRSSSPPSKPIIPGGLSQDFHKDVTPVWLDPYVPTPAVVPLSLPDDLPGLPAFAEDVRYEGPATRLIGATLPSLPVVVSSNEKEGEDAVQRGAARDVAATLLEQAEVERAREREEELKRERRRQEQRLCAEQERVKKEKEEEEAKKKKKREEEEKEEEERRAREIAKQQQAVVAAAERDTPLNENHNDDHGENNATNIVTTTTTTINHQAQDRGGASLFAAELAARASLPRADVEAMVARERAERRARHRGDIGNAMLRAFQDRYEKGRDPSA